MTSRILQNAFLGLVGGALVILVSPAGAEEIITADKIAYQLSQTRGVNIEPPQIDLPSVTFGFNSAELTALARRQLDELGTALTMPAFASSNFVVGGHTDATGTEVYNEGLSDRRARAVARYLASRFDIADSRLTPVGWGESRLRPDVDPTDGANRRVEIINMGAKQ